MVPNATKRCKIDLQLESFKDAKGLFGIEAAKTARDKKNSNSMVGFLWGWMSRITKVCIRVLSLTCTSSGCERN